MNKKNKKRPLVYLVIFFYVETHPVAAVKVTGNFWRCSSEYSCEHPHSNKKHRLIRIHPRASGPVILTFEESDVKPLSSGGQTHFSFEKKEGSSCRSLTCDPERKDCMRTTGSSWFANGKDFHLKGAIWDDHIVLCTDTFKSKIKAKPEKLSIIPHNNTRSTIDFIEVSHDHTNLPRGDLTLTGTFSLSQGGGELRLEMPNYWILISQRLHD